MAPVLKRTYKVSCGRGHRLYEYDLVVILYMTSQIILGLRYVCCFAVTVIAIIDFMGIEHTPYRASRALCYIY
jgi:hypothetical protein